MKPLRLPPPLLALSPGDLTPPGIAAFLSRAAAAIRAGLRGVLLREPGLDDRDFLDAATALRQHLPDDRGWLGIHDRPHLVSRSGADGVHLGFRSLTPSEVRSLVGPGLAIGLSTHAGDESSSWKDADYRFFGPVFDTPSKRGVVDPLGVSEWTRLVHTDSCPTWALGGIDLENLGSLENSGAAGVVMRSALLGASDITGTMRSALDSWIASSRGKGEL